MKKHKIKYFMYVVIIILTVFVGSIIIKLNNDNKYKQQLDLGNEALLNMNYEEAILAFSSAIEINKKSVEAYIGIAKAYKTENIDKAIDYLSKGYETTEDATILTMLEELRLKRDIVENAKVNFDPYDFKFMKYTLHEDHIEELANALGVDEHTYPEPSAYGDAILCSMSGEQKIISFIGKVVDDLQYYPYINWTMNNPKNEYLLVFSYRDYGRYNEVFEQYFEGPITIKSTLDDVLQLCGLTREALSISQLILTDDGTSLKYYTAIINEEIYDSIEIRNDKYYILIRFLDEKIAELDICYN